MDSKGVCTASSSRLGAQHGYCQRAALPRRPVQTRAQHRPATPLQGWLQNVADAHRDMATSMGILAARPSKATGPNSQSSQSQQVEGSPAPVSQQEASASPHTGGGLTPPSVLPSAAAAGAAVAPYTRLHPSSSSSPSPSPSPSPSRIPAPTLPSRSDLLVNNAEYGNDPDQGAFELLDVLPPVPRHHTVLPHSGLEAQDAADYEMRILAAEARDAMLAAGTSDSGSGMSSDDEDAGGSSALQAAIRRSQQRAAAIQQDARRKRASAAAARGQAAPAAPAAPAAAAAAAAAAAPAAPQAAAAPAQPMAAQEQASAAVPVPAVAVPAVHAPAAQPAPAAPVSPPAAAKVASLAPTSPPASPAAAVVGATAAAAEVVHASSQAAGGQPSTLINDKQETDEAGVPPPVVVAAHLLAAEQQPEFLQAGLAASDAAMASSDDEHEEAAGGYTQPHSQLAEQPNRFLHTQFLEPLSADSLTLAAEMLQVFGQQRAGSGSGSSSLDELLASTEEVLAAEPQMREKRRALQGLPLQAQDRAALDVDLAAGSLDAVSAGRAAVSPSPEDTELCAALGVPPKALGSDEQRVLPVFSVVNFVRARKAEEVGL